MTTSLPAQCLACRHLDRSQSLPYSDRPVVSVCAAYPNGIPESILSGGDHREPFGDETGGLVFSLLPTDDAERAFGWWEKTFAGEGDAGEA